MANDETPKKKKRGRASPVPDVSRRGFLKATGLAFSAGALSDCKPGAQGEGGSGGEDELRAPLALPDFTVDVVRPDDMVVLTIGFINLERDATGKRLVRINPLATSYFVVTFPPQHLFEAAFAETNPAAAETPPVAALLSGPSRVVLKLPPSAAPPDFNSKALLAAFRQCDMHLAPAAAYNPPLGETARLEGPADREPLSAVDAGRARRLANRRRAGAAPEGDASLVAAGTGGSGPGPTPVPQPPPVLSKTAADVTALELPFRLLLSPRPGSAWAHEHEPFVSPATGRTELWHTRLGARIVVGGQPDVRETPGATRPLRAIWTRDPGFDPNNPLKVLPQPLFNSPTSVTLADFPFKSLTEQNRAEIVHQSSNYAADVEPVSALTAKRLMLTSVGGWLDVRGDWGFASTTGLMKWEHRATQGRDHFVRVEEAAYAHTGHKVVLVTITERKVKAEKPFTAYLWQRQFIVCRNPVVSFSDPSGAFSPAKNAALRRMPFRTLELKTLVTPNLSPMPGGANVFVPKINGEIVAGGQPLRFVFEGTDWEGNVVRFTTPLVVMKANAGAVSVADANAGKNQLAALADRAPFEGQRVALAPATANDPTKVEDTTYEVTDMVFALAVDAGFDPKVPFLPFVDEAKITIEAVRHLAQASAPQRVKFPDVYANNGFGGANAGEVLFELVNAQTMSFAGSSERSGGFLTPDLHIKGVSRKNGPVGGNLSTVASNQFNPQDFFGALASAKLFGTFALPDVLEALGLDLSKAPKFVTQALDDATALLVDLQKIIQALTELGENPDGFVAKAEQAIDDLVSGALDAVPASVGELLAALDDLPAQLSALPLPDGARRELVKRAELVRSAFDGAMGTLVDLFNAYQKAEELAKNLTVNLEWKTALAPFPKSDPIFEPKPGGGLLLGVEVRGKATAGKPAGVDLVCSLEKFDINLIAPANFIQLKFDKLQFRVANGKKPDLDVVFGGIKFVGPLSFVEKLKEIIPLDGFSDPPNLEVGPEGVTARFSLPIPAVAVGVFSLENISVGAGFKVPFIGAQPLSVNFFFCTREAPFTLTVCMLGGGGFFGIELTPDGVHLIEAALEFGANLSIDLGVASGGVSIMAGIYFKWEDGAVELTGYLRIRGEVDVLGLIRASIELYLEFQYLAVAGKPGKVWGRATIEIEIEIVFLSFTVTATAEKRFSGSNEDPTFADVMGPCDPLLEPACDPTYSPWHEYVEAFV
ncbi:MAG TPA: hypothetical protein VFS43_13715 [Polyangiaceae bacterium]|nr:hypothetical protein [Polyangiaceae bacterium]